MALPRLAKWPRTGRMTLGQYLQDNSISFSEFARRIGTPHARTVSRYVKGTRVPSGRMMGQIVKATGGAVQVSDFFEPAPAAADAGA